jgi:hypothetical protein
VGLPDQLGPAKEVFRRWRADGTWQRLLAHAQTRLDAAGEVDWEVVVDATVMRAPPERWSHLTGLGHKLRWQSRSSYNSERGAGLDLAGGWRDPVYGPRFGSRADGVLVRWVSRSRSSYGSDSEDGLGLVAG